jgi:carboxymethylenebutenolidase
MIVNSDEIAMISTPEGPMRTVVFKPVAPGKYPGILLYSEIFQITGPIRRLATRFASAGYIVAVPEIYHEFEPAGTVFAYDNVGLERGNALKTIKELDSYDADARAAFAFLKTHQSCTGIVGTAGFCIGGHLAFRAAMNPECRAAACFYPTDIHKKALGKGMNDNTLDRIPEIKGEVLLIFGRQDPHIPTDGRMKIFAALEAAGTLFQFHEFNAQHAFLRDEGPRWDPAAGQLAFDTALELFHRRLGQGDLPIATTGSSEAKH